MWYPERAAIKTPTLEDAKRLNDFCSALGFRGLSDIADEWSTYEEETCFDYVAETGTKRTSLLHADCSWYYCAREDREEGIDLIPDEYFMITVDEFITICENGNFADEDDKIDLASIL